MNKIEVGCLFGFCMVVVDQVNTEVIEHLEIEESRFGQSQTIEKKVCVKFVLPVCRPQLSNS